MTTHLSKCSDGEKLQVFLIRRKQQELCLFSWRCHQYPHTPITWRLTWLFSDYKRKTSGGRQSSQRIARCGTTGEWQSALDAWPLGFLPSDFSPRIDLPRSVMDCLLRMCRFTWEARSERISNISLPQPNWIDGSSKQDSSAAGVLNLLFQVHCLLGGISKQKQLISVCTDEKKHPAPKHHHCYTSSNWTRVFQPSWLCLPKIFMLDGHRAHIRSRSAISTEPWRKTAADPRCHTHQGMRWGLQPASIAAGSAIFASRSPYQSSSSHSKKFTSP